MPAENNFQVEPVILLRNLCSVHLPKYYYIEPFQVKELEIKHDVIHFPPTELSR